MGVRTFTKEEQRRIVLPLIRSLPLPQKGKPLLVALQGGQGTGKTTVARFLKKALHDLGYRVEAFSLDDFYKSNTARKKLSQQYKHNPFYQISRGMPGTHRLSLLRAALQAIKAGRSFTLPRFDKSLHHGQGDILPSVKVPPVDIAIFEGWCVGIPFVSARELAALCLRWNIPLRKLDPQLRYSPVVLHHIKPYQPLWKLLDYVVMIKPDTPAIHKEWRLLQEKLLIKSRKRGMSAQDIRRFVDAYLPFTYLCYDKIIPNAIILVNKKHQYYRLQTATVLKSASPSTPKKRL